MAELPTFNLNFSDYTPEQLRELSLAAKQAAERAETALKNKMQNADFLKSKKFAELLKRYKALKKRRDALEKSQKVNVVIPLTLTVEPNLSDIDDVLGVDYSLTDYGHEVSATIGKGGKFTNDQKTALEQGLEQLTESDGFCDLALDLIPSLSQQISALESDLESFGEELQGQEVDRGWLVQRLSDAANG